MIEIKDYNKLNEALNKIREKALEMLENLPQNETTKELRKKLLECKDGVKLIEYINEVLIIQLDYMNEHPELYPKYE